MDLLDVRVLVVEDDEFTRIATIDILKSCKYNVESVENGQEALQLLLSKQGHFDLVLCDVMLPVMDGIELLERMQSDDNISYIPVVMTSSNEEMGVVTNCLSKGAKDYLIKPIQVNTAKTLVRHVWLSRKAKNSTDKPLWRDLDVLKTIGKGTHGTVVLARRRTDGAVVALKQIQTSTIPESGRVQADNEVTLLKALYHVNIVRFYDSFIEDGELCIVMEYADGGNLREAVKRQVRDRGAQGFGETQILSWFSQLVLAVAYIHGKNVLHRDLKAQNVFLTRSNVVKIGDFGISKALAPDALTNTACGTPESMSPEICRGERYGKKSDIWALGCVLYEMIMLRRPFEAANLQDMFTKICRGDYEPIPASYSRDLRLLVTLMLQLDPAKRPCIEDIYRFPFVQKPIQEFLSEHVAEFQQALVVEARLLENSNHDTYRNAKEALISRNRSESIREAAMAAAISGISMEGETMQIASTCPNTTTLPSNVDWRDELGEKLREAVSVTDRRISFLTTHYSCVLGSDLVGALRVMGKSTQEAIEVVETLRKSNVLHLIASENRNHIDSPRTLFRFQVDEMNQPLNMRYIWREKGNPPNDVCRIVRQAAGELFDHSSFPSGVRQTLQFREFVRCTGELQRVDLLSMAKPERQSFFLNAYNTMVIHGFIVFGIPQSNEAYRNFEKQVIYNIGGTNLSLGDIRHGILRGNRKPPSYFWGKQFESDDPKIKLMLHIRDPRCLLALIDSCEPLPNAKDCPIFKPGSTDTALENFVEKYCRRYVIIDKPNMQVHLPKIFRLYREDFCSTDSELLRWITQYIKDVPENFRQFRMRYSLSIAC